MVVCQVFTNAKPVTSPCFVSCSSALIYTYMHTQHVCMCACMYKLNQSCMWLGRARQLWDTPERDCL